MKKREYVLHRRRNHAVATGVCVAFGLAVFASSGAAALCNNVANVVSNYSVAGKWSLQQNNGMTVELTLNVIGDYNTDKKGNEVTGTATHSGGRHSGTVKGFLNLDKFEFTIYWQGKTGAYSAHIDPAGWVVGTTYDKDAPSSTASFRSTKQMWHCIYIRTTSTPPPARPATPPPVKPPVTSQPQTPPSATAPTISANPKVVTIPAGQTTGTTTLTWDAGKDHPYAEVWVQVDDGDERQIVEQGKGTRQVNVRPGKTYLYILTDSGRRLSTVTVTTK